MNISSMAYATRIDAGWLFPRQDSNLHSVSRKRVLRHCLVEPVRLTPTENALHLNNETPIY